MDANSWPQDLCCAERGSVKLSLTCAGRQGWLLRLVQEGVVFEITRGRMTQILYHPWEPATLEHSRPDVAIGRYKVLVLIQGKFYASQVDVNNPATVAKLSACRVAALRTSE